MSQTIAQKRSEFALLQLSQIPYDKDFATLAAGLPSMILQNGFGQALSFLLSKATEKENNQFKKQEKHYCAFKIIVDWLKERQILNGETEREAVFQLSKMPQDKYLMAQEEAMKVMEWVKRYANSGLFHARGD
jgi:CRISPR-associated protein Cmr5